MFLDSGRYTCSVNHGNHTVRGDTLLQVVSYPKITLTQNATVARNTTAALLCKVESVPVSHITWKRHQIPQSQWSSAAVQEGGIPGAVAQTSQSEGTPSVTVSQLHFPSVQPHHAGLYVCLAANKPGTARATLSLRVMYAPIAVIHERVTVGWPGHIPNLHIQFKADPSPRVTCTHRPKGIVRHIISNDVNDTESNVINENDAMGDGDGHWKIIEETEGEMTNITIQLFPELAKNNVFGNYSCVAYNTAGETTALIQLLEGKVPQPPEVSIDSQKPTWLVLKLRMPADMGLPPADRIIARYEDISEVGGEVVEFDKAVTAKASNSSQHWNLTGLNPGHEYRVSLQLANAIAHSNYTYLVTKLPLYAPPDAVQFISDPSGGYPRAYVLSWLPPATHGASLTGYTLRYAPVRVSDGRTGPHILEVIGAEHRVKVQKSAKTLVISGLKEATYYRTTMIAHSHVGDSELSTFLFTTANDTDTSEKSGIGGSVHYSRLPHDSHESQVLLGNEQTPESESSVHGSGVSTFSSVWTVVISTVCVTLFSSGTILKGSPFN
ncbi:fasciclin-2-like [Littorina saxatilis]|uniref:fasciclin-2-like n=1 Tax=Littorina saxatilis TaxID=31220 RepID=UPI0038B47E7E